ncbi:valine--tRNA ligase, mitochondrial-like [Poecile atricapillus]|uniref:valine--tRNA ligase, mitochondrial-like n=1 Tax=Poecile atricapillus TaxID=48891 RepID=UPI0027389192|nr:valine--tRNA ligase, mitochondrial-like [Poecile atricapillus]
MVSPSCPLMSPGLELPVATTRPETIFGDVAVAVHPRDPRYLHLQGRQVRHFFSGALLPVVSDPSVEPQRGTGAVKVTPGHSLQDLALARVHRLPLPCVIGDDGTLCPPGGGLAAGPRDHRGVSGLFLHPEFSPGSRCHRGVPEFYDFAVALLELERPVGPSPGHR